MLKRLRNALVVLIALILMMIPIWAFYSQLQTGLGYDGPVSIDTKAKELADSLMTDCTTEREIAMRFYSWITENIEYDYEFDTVYQYFSSKKTVETKKGICFDYANLFAVMCRYADIPCYVVDGYMREDTSRRHTWNRVCFDETWWNVDTTYDSIRLRQGSALQGFVDIGKDYKVTEKDYIITRYY